MADVSGRNLLAGLAMVGVVSLEGTITGDAESGTGAPTTQERSAGYNPA